MLLSSRLVYNIIISYLFLSLDMPEILVLNCGSSSVKFALINSHTSESLVIGLAENIATKNCKVVLKSEHKVEKHLENGCYKDVFEMLKGFLVEKII